MSNLVDIQLQIEKLQKQAAQIKAKEFHKTVAEIRKKMTAFGITLKDLQSPTKAKIKTPVPVSQLCRRVKKSQVRLWRQNIGVRKAKAGVVVA